MKVLILGINQQLGFATELHSPIALASSYFEKDVAMLCKDGYEVRGVAARTMHAHEHISFFRTGRYCATSVTQSFMPKALAAYQRMSSFKDFALRRDDDSLSFFTGQILDHIGAIAPDVVLVGGADSRIHLLATLLDLSFAVRGSREESFLACLPAHIRLRHEDFMRAYQQIKLIGTVCKWNASTRLPFTKNPYAWRWASVMWLNHFPERPAIAYKILQEHGCTVFPSYPDLGQFV